MILHYILWQKKILRVLRQYNGIINLKNESENTKLSAI